MAATVATLARAVADQPFLSELPADIIEKLAVHAHRRDYSTGELLFAEGAPADQFFLIRRGLVRLSIEVPGRGQVDVETLGADAAVGWSWLLPPYRWHLSAVAMKKTATLAFDTHRLRAVMDAEPEIGYELMKRFAWIIFDRLRALHAHLGTEVTTVPVRRSAR